MVEVEPYRQAVEMLFQLAEKEHFVPQMVSPGGGWGVRYLPEHSENDPALWVHAVSEAVQAQCARLGWPLPRLVLEPGRWIVARAGVAIYRVGSQKRTPDGCHIVAVDGGMADNPRPALYQAQYAAYTIQRFNAFRTVRSRVVGKYCESGDELIHEVMLPPVSRGDLLAVPVAGAYQLSMSSEYNLASRPAVLWLEEGAVEVLQPRVCAEDDRWWLG